MKRLVFALLCIVSLLTGCSTKKAHPAHIVTLTPEKHPKVEYFPYTPSKHNAIIDALYEEYKKWYGTPYCYGGTTTQGVDCSALVQSVYNDAFGIHVPRTTEQQATIGTFVAKKTLREGDLVLFKTGWRTRHSGIYIEGGNFLHTSSKHGVTVSNLHNPYWRNVYWQARRVLAY